MINLTKNDYGSISIDVSNVCTIEDMFPILKAILVWMGFTMSTIDDIFDEELIEMLDEAQGLCLQEEYSINEKIAVRGRFDKIKQLLTHLPTSGNNMSDKRVVTLCEIHEFCHNLLDEFEIDREDLIEIEAELAQWLKELGIEVVEK